MEKFAKPIIAVSKCLGFEACRYNGQMSNDSFVEKLKDYVEYKTVCPEVAIGLETPRDTLRLVREGENIRILQPKSNNDYTEKMMEFSNEFLKNIGEVDGFILKSRSPSCGIKDVKIYESIERGSASKKGKGIFGDLVSQLFYNLPIEDDGRLRDYTIRHHFLTKLYLMASFREIKRSKSIEELINFHNRNQLLFMSYNQKQLNNLKNVLNNKENLNKEEMFNEYEKYLALVFVRMPRYTSNIKVLMKSMEYFLDKLSLKEKEFILDTIEKYKNHHVPFTVPLYVIKSYVVRFEIHELLNQSFFEPYPEELIETRDSGKMVDN
ncbi:YbgA family protein [Haloimpatiens sp. FM7330]|uniref:YbgA family protein n=1 Tax=Haloimpatiens sp. FM7330 TaxID=3298610 RepID=UPI003644DDC2